MVKGGIVPADAVLGHQPGSRGCARAALPPGTT
jgi:hypothetical protein